MAERKYVLTIVYDKEEEQMEYLTEEIIEDEPEIYVDDMIISDYWDDEGIKLLDKMHGNDVGLT